MKERCEFCEDEYYEEDMLALDIYGPKVLNFAFICDECLETIFLWQKQKKGCER